jgi:hypothetical protein
MFYILISGKAGTGKSTASKLLKYLLKKNRINSHTDLFARGVKMVAKSMGWNGIKDDAGRKLLQGIGNVGRDYDEDVWVRLVHSSQYECKEDDFVIIDDWRFPNEYKFVKDFCVATIRLYAPNREILKGTEYYNDVSETSLNDFRFDFVVNNTGNIKELDDQLKYIIECILNE